MKNLILILFIPILFNSCLKESNTTIDPPVENPNVVKDIEGNVYNTIKIGNQTWMKENLKVKKFRNGELIPNITSASSWSNLTSAAYCNFNNSEATGDDFGRLYNFYALVDSRGLAPAGWHVPTKAEVEELITFLGGEFSAASKLKEVGTTHWTFPNSFANNSSGFTAVGSGARGTDGSFAALFSVMVLWTQTEETNQYGWYWRLFVSNDNLDYLYDPKSVGIAVRLIKDK